MDNKKWYKRFGTIFWWLLTILPIIVALIQFVGYHLTFNSGISVASDLASYHDLASGNYFDILSNTLADFDLISIDLFDNTFSDLFNIIGVDNYLTLGYLMSFMVSVQIYHLIFDLFAWLPCFFHKLLEKSNIGE